ILQAAQSLAGKSKQILLDLNLYRRQAVDPIWDQLPVPLRLLGRDKLRWDDYLLALRTELFVAQPDGRLALRPDAAARLDALAERLFGGGSAATARTPTTVRSGPSTPTVIAEPDAVDVELVPIAVGVAPPPVPVVALAAPAK